MKLIDLKKEDCPYCDINLEITGDSDKSLFNWHLKNHSNSQVFYETNNKIEKLITEYAHDFRSKYYDEELMEIMLRDFWKKANLENEEIQDLKNLVQALEYKVEACELELQAEITSRGIDNTNN